MSDSKPKPRILVIGSGPAALSAGTHLLEQAGDRIQVELVAMGHHFGGKAASWRDKQGYSIDHGFHAVFGFYDELRALARRAGVDLGRALVSSRGVSHLFDPSHRKLVSTKLRHNPLAELREAQRLTFLNDAENEQLAQAVSRMSRTVAAAPSLESFDDVCYRAFLIEHGAPPRYLETPAYRQIKELLFNTPHEISTYIVLQATRLLTHCYDDAVFSYVNGGISEQLWDPISAYFQRLGGAVRVRQKLTGLEHARRKLEGLTFGIPDNDGFHQNGTRQWPGAVPIAQGTEFHEQDFHAVICTLPAACFTELNPGDPLWDEPFFGNMRHLTSVPTLSLQVWLQNRPRTEKVGVVNGIRLPLSYAVDQKPIVTELQGDPRFGAALEWVGAEEGFEDLSDEELIRSAREGLAEVPGFEGTERDQVVHLSLKRNRSNYQRYLLTDPGTLKFRPTVETPLERLFLAGDWVRNEIDVPTMEGAVRCGKAAAARALKTL